MKKFILVLPGCRIVWGGNLVALCDLHMSALLLKLTPDTCKMVMRLENSRLCRELVLLHVLGGRSTDQREGPGACFPLTRSREGTDHCHRSDILITQVTH